MLDMGGMPAASNDQTLIRTVNASKNSKLQAVAFDFDILTKSLEQAKQQQQQPATERDEKVPEINKQVQADLDQVQQIANLLNVSVDTGTPATTPIPKSPKALPKTNVGEDIRAKYASKLKGGLAGVELAKSQIEQTLKSGDAAGHLAAREMAVRETAASPTKWMALSGTGKLLSYLTHRSIHIALLPSLKLNDDQKNETEFTHMTNLSKQLKGQAIIDCIVPFKDVTNTSEKVLKAGVLNELNIPAERVLVVSDKDDYLKAAKNLGMITCRLQPENGRRGNISAHYTAPTVPDVQEVVNEINGISFNVVLNR